MVIPIICGSVLVNEMYRRSIEIILSNQHPSGAYIASPAFPNYHYCWLRDGSYIAYAMDLVGEKKSAEAFFRWVGATIQRYAHKVDLIDAKIKAGKKIEPSDVLNTRFTLDGYEESQESGWGNFQIDGYGTWLWALSEHVRLTGDKALIHDLSKAVDITMRYLSQVWMLPNYDCWEEHPEFLHPYSLATIYGGASAVSRMVSEGLLDRSSIDAGDLAQKVKDFIDKHAIFDGILVKHIQPAAGKEGAMPVKESSVDASLMGLFVPYEVFPLDSSVALATMQAIETDLHRKKGGVYRYKADVYYGGGEWILLSAWLGWIEVCQGNIDRAVDLLNWIKNCADQNGNLPEQVNDHCLAPEEKQPWIDRWGPVATPLLWSHAMTLILENKIDEYNIKR